MKNKLKIIVITVLSTICLQATMTAFAVELPFVPVDESETDTVTTAVSDKDTPIVKEKQTSTTVTTQKPKTTRTEGKTTTSKKSVSSTDSVSPNETPVVSSDSENNDLSVVSPDEEEVKIENKTGLESSEGNSTQITAKAEDSSSSSSESKTETEKLNNSSLTIIVAAISGVVVLTGAVVFAIFKREKK